MNFDDLSDFDQVATMKMPLRNPKNLKKVLVDKNGDEFFIELKSPDDLATMADEFEAQQKALEVVSEKVADGKTLNKKEQFIISNGFASKTLAARTVGWNIWVNGEQLEFSEEVAIDLYTKSNWIKKQVDTYSSRRANFMIGSEKS